MHKRCVKAPRTSKESLKKIKIFEQGLLAGAAQTAQMLKTLNPKPSPPDPKLSKHLLAILSSMNPQVALGPACADPMWKISRSSHLPWQIFVLPTRCLPI